MKPVYSDIELEDQLLKCDNCGWQGKGDDARIVDFYGVSKTQEIHCPNCDEYLANLHIDKDDSSPAIS